MRSPYQRFPAEGCAKVERCKKNEEAKGDVSGSELSKGSRFHTGILVNLEDAGKLGRTGGLASGLAPPPRSREAWCETR